MTRNTIRNLSIYADFIDETSISCHEDVLLKTFPNVSYVSGLEYISDIDEYKKVQKRVINKMGFKFKDSMLSTSNYLEYSCNIIIALHFKNI